MELVLATVSLALGWWLQVNLVPLVIVWGMVLAAEYMNSAVEEVVDLISPDRNIRAGRAKDLAAGAVLAAAITAAIVMAITLLPPLAARLGLLA